ncbi:MAG TPA: hypothetical protein DD730_09215 [Desulfosporosinus sp.]|nr:hypothetical protein [Desulfosporosinus sp.]
MRTVPAIIILVVILLGGSFTTSRYLETTAMSLGAEIEAVEQSISTQQWEVAQNELNLAHQNLEKNKTWWTILLDHQVIDNITMSMNRIDKYIETHDVSLSLGEVSALKLQVDNILETENFSLQNIL